MSDLIMVTGGPFLATDGTPLWGRIEFTPMVAGVDDTPDVRIITEATVVAELDEMGRISIEVTASDDAGWRTTGPVPYRIAYRVPGLNTAHTAYLNGPGPVDLADVIVLEDPPIPGHIYSGPPPILQEGDTVTLPPGSEATVDITDVGDGYVYAFHFGIPAGAQGPPPVLVTGGTDTLPPGSDATSEVVGTGTAGEYEVAFGIPAGATGPAPTIQVGDTDTLEPGSDATVDITDVGDDAYRIDFGIPQGIQGIQGEPGDLTQAVADLRYERRLLTEAVGWWDASVVTADGLSLTDLSGRDHPMVLGAGVAAPLVLPHTGSDYVGLPHRADAASSVLKGVSALACSDATVTIHGSIEYPAGAVGPRQFVQVGDGTTGWVVYLESGTEMRSRRYGAATAVALISGGAPTRLWNRWTHQTSTGVTMWEDSDDGVTWASRGTASHGVCVPSTRSDVSLGGASAAHSAAGSRYRVEVVCDGTLLHIMDPAYVDTSTYSSILNTGAAGGSWTITRPTSGSKLAVVDRPLVQFSGRQLMDAMMPPVGPSGTLLMACRIWSDTMVSRIWLGASAAEVDGAYAYVTPSTTSVVNLCYQGADETTRADLNAAPFGQHVLGSRLSPARFDGLLDGVQMASDATVTADVLIADRVRVGSAVAGGAFMEFLAVAVFDRALTDAEVAQASSELLGLSHTDQPDPHPQYALRAASGWGTVPTWASLPPTGTLVGQQVRVSDGLGLCVAVWTGTKWVVDPVSDTGWYPLTLINGWTGSLHIRRQGYHVQLGHAVHGNLSGSGSTATAPVAPLGPGWKPPFAVVFHILIGGGVWGALTVAYQGTVTLTQGGVANVSTLHPTGDAWPTAAPA